VKTAVEDSAIELFDAMIRPGGQAPETTTDEVA
jgi:putative intracellular protease/amidase